MSRTNRLGVLLNETDGRRKSWSDPELHTLGSVGDMLTPEEWAERYRQCWEAADATAVRELFTSDATYRSDIFAEPHRGRDGIEAYWRNVTEPQTNVSVRMGRPIVGDQRVAVEWWTQMDVDGEPSTVPGCLLLRFDDDGLCTELEEYFRYTPGREEPPANWGL